MVICLERGANDSHMVQLMPLPFRRLLLQQNPEWLILLVTAYPGCPGKKAVKQNSFPGSVETLWYRNCSFASLRLKKLLTTTELPFLLVFIDAVAARTKCHDKQQSTGDRQRLKEVVLDKVTTILVSGHRPPCVEVYVDGKQPRDQHERRQARLVADGDENDECCADDVLDCLLYTSDAADE